MRDCNCWLNSKRNLEKQFATCAVMLVENIECANSLQLTFLLKTIDNTTGRNQRGRCLWLLTTSLGENVVTAKADKLRWKKQDRFIQSMKPFLLENLDPELGQRIDGFFPVLPSWHVQRSWAKQKLQRFRVRLFKHYKYALQFILLLAWSSFQISFQLVRCCDLFSGWSCCRGNSISTGVPEF